MKRLFPLLSLIWLLPTYCAANAQTPRPTPVGSFLKHRVATVNQLVYQANRDSQVRTRYAQHFGVNAKQIPLYFRTLSLIALETTTSTQIYYIDKHGKAQVKKEALPKGSLIFAEADGTPVLVWPSGNPVGRHKIMLAKISGAKVADETAKPAPESSSTAEKPDSAAQVPIETKVLANTPEIVTSEVITEAALPIPGDIIAQLPNVIVAPAALATTEAVTQSVSHGIGALPYLGGLAGLLGGIALASGGSNTIALTDGLIGPPVSVPEPSAAAALATGLIGLVGIAGKRRRAT